MISEFEKGWYRVCGLVLSLLLVMLVMLAITNLYASLRSIAN